MALLSYRTCGNQPTPSLKGYAKPSRGGSLTLRDDGIIGVSDHGGWAVLVTGRSSTVAASTSEGTGNAGTVELLAASSLTTLTSPRIPVRTEGTTRLNPHHTCNVDSPFAGRVRAVFLNSRACSLLASRDGPCDQAPSSEESV